MYQPEVYAIVLSFMVVSMLCWGSWANTMKLCPGFRFQLFYWDYVIGLFLGACMGGLTLGSFGSSGRSFLADIAQVSLRTALLAILGGVVFNIANLLLVAAIDIAGLAVAFPIGIGLALLPGQWVAMPFRRRATLFCSLAELPSWSLQSCWMPFHTASASRID